MAEPDPTRVELVCPSCGAEVHICDGIEFCERCGYSSGAYTMQAKPPSDKTDPRKDST